MIVKHLSVKRMENSKKLDTSKNFLVLCFVLKHTLKFLYYPGIHHFMFNIKYFNKLSDVIGSLREMCQMYSGDTSTERSPI